MTANSKEQPYKPSWIDRFTDWVERLPVQGWVFYGGLGLGLILLQLLVLWLDGGQPAGELLPIIVFNALMIPFSLSLVHLLDNQAVSILDSMRPVLDMDESQFHRSQYELATMPSRPALVAGLSVLVFAILMERLWITPVRFAALEQLPVFVILFHIIDKIPAFTLGVLFYHTIRQLRLVNTISQRYTRISLFHLGPLQAFSRLTASTAVGLLVGIYAWMVINPELLADPVSLGLVGAITLMAVTVFAWPLYGVHKRMQMEKEKALYESDLLFEAVFSKLNQLVRDGDHAAADRLHGTVASLEIQRRRIAAIPTWPWRPETARFVLAAIAIPLVLTTLQLLAVQALGW